MAATIEKSTARRPYRVAILWRKSSQLAFPAGLPWACMKVAAAKMLSWTFTRPKNALSSAPIPGRPGNVRIHRDAI
jgi:hypothetical protein